MNWLRKWAYMIIFLVLGAVYLAFVDHWQVYAESLRHVKEWYEDSGNRVGGWENPDVPPEAGDIMVADNGSGNDESGYDESSSGTVDGVSDVAAGHGNSGESPGIEGSGAEGGNSGAVGGESGEGNPGLTGEENRETNPSETGAEGEPDQSSTQDAEYDGGETGEDTKIVTYMTVEDDYFADAVFIGDSRTMGMYEYGGLEEVSTFYASKGLTVYKIFDSQIVQAPGGKITVEEALQQNTFAKIYLMIGINEMGTGTVETFLEKYREVVEHLQELQPDAIIYIQAIIKVTSERSAKGDYINNEGIEARNEGIALMADNEKIFYLDVNPEICDETGGLNSSYTFDGVHLLGKYIQLWKDYLKAHAISP